MKLESKPYIENLLKLVATWDAHDILYWNSSLMFYVNCNDLFAWGCADCEGISSQNDVDLLEKCFNIMKAHGREWDTESASFLYAAQKRKMRPQNAMFKHIDKSIHYLFDECGLPRPESYPHPKLQVNKFEN